MITGLLVVAGAALVVLSVVTGNVLLAYVAVSLAVLAGVALFLPRWLAASGSVRGTTRKNGRRPAREERRLGRFRTTRKARARDVGTSDAAPVGETASTTPSVTVETATRAEAATPVKAASATDGTVPARTPSMVVVVPGRHRYHVEGCDLVKEHRHDSLSLDEALEEEFTPCTRCVPDGARTVQAQS